MQVFKITGQFNVDHKKGGSKARFMRDTLGYLPSDSKLFHKNIVSAIIGKLPVKSVMTEYGPRYTFHTQIIGKSDKSVTANVVVVIQKDHGRITYKIITVYPGKKGE